MLLYGAVQIEEMAVASFLGMPLPLTFLMLNFHQEDFLYFQGIARIN
jgi:hypothetical protein